MVLSASWIIGWLEAHAQPLVRELFRETGVKGHLVAPAANMVLAPVIWSDGLLEISNPTKERERLADVQDSFLICAEDSLCWHYLCEIVSEIAMQPVDATAFRNALPEVISR